MTTNTVVGSTYTNSHPRQPTTRGGGRGQFSDGGSSEERKRCLLVRLMSSTRPWSGSQSWRKKGRKSR
jgi:hypothetical protein